MELFGVMLQRSNRFQIWAFDRTKEKDLVSWAKTRLKYHLILKKMKKESTSEAANEISISLITLWGRKKFTYGVEGMFGKAFA